MYCDENMHACIVIVSLTLYPHPFISTPTKKSVISMKKISYYEYTYMGDWQVIIFFLLIINICFVLDFVKFVN